MSTPHPCLTRRFIEIAIRSGIEASNGGLTLSEDRPGKGLNWDHCFCPAIGVGYPNEPTFGSHREVAYSLSAYSMGWVARWERGLSSCVATQWRPPRMIFDSIWAVVLVLIHAAA